MLLVRCRFFLTVAAVVAGPAALAAPPAIRPAPAVDATAAVTPAWVRVDLAGPIEYKLPTGEVRTLEPSCSGGPRMNDDGDLVAAPLPYAFFVQHGRRDRLLIGMDGGGACWNALTCIGSALLGSPTYSQFVDETTTSLAQSGGLFDTGNPDNPYADYTKIFVPYCSADVHWGSKDTTYALDLGGGVVLPWTIRHRGADNFLAVLAWMRGGGLGEGPLRPPVRELSIIGASAGGYGTNIAFAYVADLYPRARLTLISDAAIGVQTEGFVREAFFDPDAPGTESWGVSANLPTWIPGFDATLLANAVATPNGLLPAAFASLSAYRPDARFASLTSHLDAVQIAFFALMRGDPFNDPAVAAAWYAGMAQITAATAALPNYRFNIDAGTYHTAVATDERVYSVGANGVALVDWIGAMLAPDGVGWVNLDAGPPTLP